MTVDPKLAELVQQLQALGIDPETAPQWVQSNAVDVLALGTVQKQREVLLRIRDALRAQLKEDQAQLEEAHLSLQRLKNGGGT